MRLSCSPFVSSPVLLRVQKQPWRWCLQPGRIHRLELQASLPLPQAQSSAALPSGIYKAKEAVRSQCSAPENLNVSLKETLSQELGIHQYEVTRLPWAPLDTILHKHLESFASDLLSWPSVIWWTHLGRKKAFVFRLRCWILLPVLSPTSSSWKELGVQCREGAAQELSCGAREPECITLQPEWAVGIYEGTSVRTEEYLLITHEFGFRNLLCDPSPFPWLNLQL